MATTLASNAQWGSSPKIYFDFSYDKQRSGTTQQYKITVNCDPVTGDRYFGYPIYLEIKLAGTVMATKTLKAASPSRWSDPITYTTGWLDVPNKVTGTTALAIRIYSGSGSSRNTTYSYSLAVDPAPSTIAATDANIESTSTVTFDRKSSAFTHTLAYKAEGQSSYTNIFTKQSVTSYGWTVPKSLYALIPNDREITVTLRCQTYNGDTLVGTEYAEMTATTAESKCRPTISVTAEDVNSNTIALTGDKKKLIMGYSHVKVTATAEAQNSASITRTSLWCGVDHVSASTHIFTAPKRTTVMAAAYDTREYSSNDMAEGLSGISYVELTNNATAKRTSPTSDTVKITTKGNYYNGSFGAVANTLRLQVRYKPASRAEFETTDTWTEMTVTISGNTYTAEATLTGLDYTQAYSIRVRAQDKIHVYEGPLANAVYHNFTLSKGVPVFDWGEDDFKFNVPVEIEGCGNFPGDGWEPLNLTADFKVYDGAAENTPVYRKVGNLVEVSGTVSPTAEMAGSADKIKIGTLPEGYRPKTHLGIICQGSSTAFWHLHISTAGNITFSRYRNENGYAAATTTTWLGFHCMFFAN